MESAEKGLNVTKDNLGLCELNDKKSEGELKTCEYTFKSTLAQCCVAFVNSLSFLIMGMLLGAPPMIVGAVINSKEGLSITLEQSSYYVSLLFLTQPIGCLAGGYLQNYIGRKLGMQLMNVLAIISWLFVSKATSLEMLNLCSTLTGITIGFVEAPGITYISEVTEPRIRGILSSYVNLKTIVGLMTTFWLGYITDWRTACLIGASVPALSIFFFLLLPESPFWLMGKGRKHEALKSLCWLRGWVHEEVVMEEFESICKHVQISYLDTRTNLDGHKNTATIATDTVTGTIDKAGRIKSRSFIKFFVNCFSCVKCLKCDSLKFLLQASTLRPFTILLCYQFFAVCAVAGGVRSYILEILKELDLPWSAHLVAVLIGLTGILGNVFGGILIKIIGKRWTSLISIVLSVITTLTTGILMYCKCGAPPWAFAFVFLFSSFAAFLGCVQIPWILLGELYPIKTRSIATGITGALFNIILSISTKTYPDLKLYLDTHGCFILYSILGLLGVLFIWFYLPETEGMTLADIEKHFSAKSTHADALNLNDSDSIEQGTTLLDCGETKELVALMDESVNFGSGQIKKPSDGIFDLGQNLYVNNEYINSNTSEGPETLDNRMSGLTNDSRNSVKEHINLDIGVPKLLDNVDNKILNCDGISEIAINPIAAMNECFNSDVEQLKQSDDCLTLVNSNELKKRTKKPIIVAKGSFNLVS